MARAAAKEPSEAAWQAASFGDLATVEAVDGKGLGVVAARQICKGECVLTETPLLGLSFPTDMLEAMWQETGQFPEGVEAQLRETIDSLSSEARELFWSLSDNRSNSGSSSACGICLTNALVTGGESEGAISALASRFNHSCVPNINQVWHEDRGLFEFYALRDIEPGEEMAIYYDAESILLDGESRREALRSQFHFDCKCEKCMLEGDALRASDESREKMARLELELQQALARTRLLSFQLRPKKDFCPRSLASVDELLDLADSELSQNSWIKAGFAYGGFELARAYRQPRLAARMLRTAYEEAFFSEGPDGAMVEFVSQHLENLRSAPVGASAKLQKERAAKTSA